jgi:hypothetical protein
MNEKYGFCRLFKQRPLPKLEVLHPVYYFIGEGLVRFMFVFVVVIMRVSII